MEMPHNKSLPSLTLSIFYRRTQEDAGPQPSSVSPFKAPQGESTNLSFVENNSGINLSTESVNKLRLEFSKIN